MKLDVYTCSCGNGFAVEENEWPVRCPFCHSDVFEYSHTVFVVSEPNDDLPF